MRSAEKELRSCGGEPSSANMSSSSTSKSEETATCVTKRDGYWAGEEEHLTAEKEREWSLKESEGGKTETEAERETQRGRDLGLKEERETEEAEADMAKG